jgi:hypothetical protein
MKRGRKRIDLGANLRTRFLPSIEIPKAESQEKPILRDDVNGLIRASQCDLSLIPEPIKSDIFGNNITLHSIFALLIDDTPILNGVREGKIPIETYFIAREWARIAMQKWPSEFCMKFNEYRGTL